MSGGSGAMLPQPGGELVVDERASSSAAGINHALLPCGETNPVDFRPLFCFHVLKKRAAVRSSVGVCWSP